MKLKYIDALRGLAIIGVLVVHCSHAGSDENLPEIMRSVVFNGAHGVQLFYVASAFTLFLSLANRKASEQNGWLKFYVRRFFRIAPMYYLGVCYYLWQDGLGPRFWLGDATRISEWNVLSNLTFIHGFNPYWISSIVPGGWSIAVEMLFYCLLPLLFLKITNANQAFAFVLITLLIRIVLQFLLNRFPLIASEELWTHYLYVYFPNQLPVFGLGILLYFLTTKASELSLSPLVVFLSFFVLAAHLVGMPLLPNHILFGIAFVVLAIALSRFEFKIFVNPVVVYLGKVSYSMYLVHFAVLYWLGKYGFVDYVAISGPSAAILNYVIRLLVLGALTVSLASLFYSTVELPMQRMGSKLINRFHDRNKPRLVTGGVAAVQSEIGGRTFAEHPQAEKTLEQKSA
jgi:peptidoglycan/LPS O-acetylase OafA/YrhL